MVQTLNPAPRVSVLHALSSSGSYFKQLDSKGHQQITTAANGLLEIPHAGSSPETPSRPTKRKRVNRVRSEAPSSANVNINDSTAQGDLAERGDLKELGVLFNLWRSAGRHVNLWDWLEGFRGNMMGPQNGVPVEEAPPEGSNEREGIEEEDEEAATPRATQQTPLNQEQLEDLAKDDKDGEDLDEEKAARLHAAFVRFCEEARMMGLVRARGRAKRADEVVKSIALV